MAPPWSFSCLLVVFPIILALLPDHSFSAAQAQNSSSKTILRHVQILFRHGDRAPLYPLFPTDPYRLPVFWEHGLDQLTNTGRARMFRLGQMIRAKYDSYLGQEFSPREISARSSAIDRCLESAQLVLAGTSSLITF